MTKTELQKQLFSRLCDYFKQFDMHFEYSDELSDGNNSVSLSKKYYLLYDNNHRYLGWRYPNLKTMLLTSKNYFSLFEYNYAVMDPYKKYYDAFEPLKQLKSSCIEELAMKMDLMGI
jgi:hypothetical protein